MARKASKLVLEMGVKRKDILMHIQESINRIEKGEPLPVWYEKDVNSLVKRAEGYNVAFEDLLHVSKCYRGYNYLDKDLAHLIWYPQYEQIQDHPEFAEWRRHYYV